MKAIAGGIGVATDKEIIRAALQPANYECVKFCLVLLPVESGNP
jgi:hypothetical protein